MRSGPWRTEFRRSLGFPFFAINAALNVWILFVHPEWAAEWITLVTLQRWGLIVTGSVLVTAAAWYAGRERRRSIGELINSTSLPRGRRHALMLSTLLVGAIGGHLFAFAVAAVFVIQQSDYHGGGWWWIVLLSCLGLCLMGAVGWVIGMLIPYRLTAPIAGVASYIGIVVLTFSYRDWFNLLPTGFDSVYAGSSPTSFGVAVSAAFLLLTASGLLWLVLSESRMVWGLVALAGAASLAFTVPDPDTDRWWTPDPEATAPVCTNTKPTVCVWNAHAKFLESTEAALVPVLQRLGEEGPSSAQEWDPYRTLEPDVLEIQIGNRIPLIGSDLRSSGDLRAEAAMSPLLSCYFGEGEDGSGTFWSADNAVTELLMDGLESGMPDAGDELWRDGPDGVRRFGTATEQQQTEFIRTYFALAHDCDIDGIERLATTWQPN